MPTDEYISLPFAEAIRFFRDKVDIPTGRWNDLWKGMHARGFMVAGAAKSALLCDFRTAVDQAIAKGTTIEEFRKAFDDIVARHGWSYNGGRNWRSRVIYDTNIRTAYNAGRHQQMTDPDVLAARPYWEYRHGDSAHPRELHLSWHGLVLRYDDPWWETHDPSNGWGCKCKKYALGDRDLKRLGKGGPDTAPDDGTYIWEDKATGTTHTIPNGIDPGWDYSVGRAAWGEKLSGEAMSEWDAQGKGAWRRLGDGDWQTHQRPARIPVDKPKAGIGETQKDQAAVKEYAERLLGGKEKVFTFEAEGIRSDVLVNAAALSQHIAVDRSPYLPFLEELLTAPYEIWASFEQHRGTGRVVLRQRIIKAVQLRKKMGLLFVAQAKNGIMEDVTFLPAKDLSYLNRQREGKLLWGRE